jgi:hypothetical protein
MQTYTSDSGNFSLQFPDYWEFEMDESTLTFFDSGEDGVGAFQVTEFGFDEGAEIDVSRQLAESIAEFHDMDVKEVSTGIQQNGNKAWTTFEEGDTYWMYWMFFKDQTLLFITYNCEIPDKGIEDNIAQQMADSIKLA